VAALFTEDGVLLAPDGMFSGRQDIEKRYADTFRRSPISDFNSRRERRYLNAIDNAVWSAGQWTATLQGQNGPEFAWGYWSAIYVQEGNIWEIRMLSLVEHPAPRFETK
jgi:ketosteroid isomerase-like protein